MNALDTARSRFGRRAWVGFSAIGALMTACGAPSDEEIADAASFRYSRMRSRSISSRTGSTPRLSINYSLIKTFVP